MGKRNQINGVGALSDRVVRKGLSQEGTEGAVMQQYEGPEWSLVFKRQEEGQSKSRRQVGCVPSEMTEEESECLFWNSERTTNRTCWQTGCGVGGKRKTLGV